MLDQVIKWVLTGASEQDVIEAIGTAWPTVEARPLIAVALDRLTSEAQFDPQLVTGFCLEATRELYRRMLEIGDFAGALKAIKQLHELAEEASKYVRGQEAEGEGQSQEETDAG